MSFLFKALSLIVFYAVMVPGQVLLNVAVRLRLVEAPMLGREDAIFMPFLFGAGFWVACIVAIVAVGIGPVLAHIL